MWAKRLSGALISAVFGALCLLMFAQSAAQETPTPEPTLTRTPDPRSTIWTPPPARYQLRVTAAKLLPDTNFLSNGIGMIAVDDDGLLYVGDGFTNVRVYSPTLDEVRRFEVQQPSDLAFAPDGALIIGQRNQATLRAYTKNGVLLRTLWSAESSVLESFAIAPNGEIAVIATQSLNPTITSITRLSANGEVLNYAVFAELRTLGDSIHGAVFTPNLAIALTVSGYNLIDPVLAAFVTLDDQGKIMRSAPLPMQRDLIAPAVPTRLTSGDLLIFSTEYLGWWSKSNVRLAQIEANAFRVGFPMVQQKRRAAIAPHPDSQSVYVAEVYSTGELAVARVELVDRLSGGN